MVKLYTLAFCLVLTAVSVRAISIDDYGAVAGSLKDRPDHTVAQANSLALAKAIAAAGATEVHDSVVIPAKKVYWIQALHVANLTNLSIVIDGTLKVHDDIAKWPQLSKDNGKTEFLDVMNFQNCTDITFTSTDGDGLVEGNGYEWWEQTLLNKIPNKRPDLINMRDVRNVVIEKLEFKNSPRFHIYASDVDGMKVRYVKIIVDVDRQKEILHKHNKWHLRLNIPMYAFNTDGIDPAGKNIHIHDCTINNYDDAVAVKPSHQGNVNSDCTENVLVERVQVFFGVGMSIGSVPPNDKINCVRNVVFRDIDFYHPFKAVYIKTNPGDHGSGIIDNILYENLKISYPIWWSIYIGPQQQHQPDGAGPGCLIYPINPKCATQPRVTVSNVVLRNVVSTGNWLMPGIIRCNKHNPCTGFVFDNVKVGGWLSHLGYICENVEGTAMGGTSPAPRCFHKKSKGALEFLGSGAPAPDVSYQHPAAAAIMAMEEDELMAATRFV